MHLIKIAYNTPRCHKESDGVSLWWVGLTVINVNENNAFSETVEIFGTMTMKTHTTLKRKMKTWSPR